MNQPALTKRIVDSLGLKDQRLHDIPAEPNVRLTKDEDGPERKDKFHYRSLIGQLNYLTASTRPEIQFATHQLARFSENPKMSHEKAAKRVVRYLKGTLDEGIIMKPDRSQGLTCYVDFLSQSSCALIQQTFLKFKTTKEKLSSLEDE